MSEPNSTTDKEPEPVVGWRERAFVMDLAPKGAHSTVNLDGDDISRLVQSVVVRSGVHGFTTVELQTFPSAGVQLRARLPEARVVISIGGVSLSLTDLDAIRFMVARAVADDPGDASEADVAAGTELLDRLEAALTAVGGGAGRVS